MPQRFEDATDALAPPPREAPPKRRVRDPETPRPRRSHRRTTSRDSGDGEIRRRRTHTRKHSSASHAADETPRHHKSPREPLTEEERKEREERRARRAARAERAARRKEALERSESAREQPAEPRERPTHIDLPRTAPEHLRHGKGQLLTPGVETPTDETGDVQRHAEEEPRSSRKRRLTPAPQGQVGQMPEGRVFPFTGVDNVAALMENDSFHMACFSIYLFRSTLDYNTVREFFEVLLQLYPKYRYVADLRPYSARRRDREKRKQLKALNHGPPGAREAYERELEELKRSGHLPYNPGPRTMFTKSLKVGSILRPAQWRIDYDFHVSENIEVLSCGGRGDDNQLHRIAGRFLARHFDFNKPLWEALLVQGLRTSEGARSALMIKIHHSFSDGQGMIQSYHAALMAMGKDMGIKDVQQYADQMRAKKGSKPKPRRTLRHTIAHSYYTMYQLYCRRRRTFTYKDPSKNRAPGRLYYHSEGVRMEDIKLIRKAFSTDTLELTLNDVALALLTRAMQRVSPYFVQPGKKSDKRAAFFVPISLRPAGDWKLYNYTSGALAWMPYPDPSPASVGPHLAAVSKEMQRVKNSYLPLWGYSIVDKFSKRRLTYAPNFIFGHSLYNKTVSEYHVATNVPGPTEPVKFGRHEAYSYHVLPPSSPGKATMAIGLISYAQDFSLAIACDDVPEFAELPRMLCIAFQDAALVMIDAARQKLNMDSKG